jgi:hypothetical protein
MKKGQLNKLHFSFPRVNTKPSNGFNSLRCATLHVSLLFHLARRSLGAVVLLPTVSPHFVRIPLSPQCRVISSLLFFIRQRSLAICSIKRCTLADAYFPTILFIPIEAKLIIWLSRPY